MFKSLKKTFASDSSKVSAALLVGVLGLFITAGALNGGVALTASVWDGLRTTINDMLTSTWTLALAFIALLVAVWQIGHGRGYGYLAVVLGLMATAIIGPGFVTSIATATRAANADHISIEAPASFR